MKAGLHIVELYENLIVGNWQSNHFFFRFTLHSRSINTEEKLPFSEDCSTELTGLSYSFQKQHDRIYSELISFDLRPNRCRFGGCGICKCSFEGHP